MSVTTSVDPSTVTLPYIGPTQKKPEYFRKWLAKDNKPKTAFDKMPLAFQTAFNDWNLYAPFDAEVKAHTYTAEAQWHCDVEYTFKVGSTQPQAEIKGHVHVKQAGNSLEWICGHFWVVGVGWADGKTPVALRRIIEKAMLEKVTTFLT